jgi:hypothetical protein
MDDVLRHVLRHVLRDVLSDFIIRIRLLVLIAFVVLPIHL